jgi:hypothetical protein
VWLGGDECSKPDQAENRGWLYRNCGGERVSVCGIRKYPGWVLSPEQIYGAVWKESVAGCEHVVYNVICQLRKKLKNPDMIQTVVGRGYRFVG